MVHITIPLADIGTPKIWGANGSWTTPNKGMHL